MKMQTSNFSRNFWRILSVLLLITLVLSLPGMVEAGPVSQPITTQSQEIGGQDADGSSAPVYQQTSAFLAGRVAVGVVAIESNTSSIPNQEDWTTDELTQVRNEIWTGLQKWVNWKPSALPLEFVVDIDGDETADDMGLDAIVPVEISNEPIVYSAGTYNIWVRQAMEGMGYTDGLTAEDAAYQYANALRTQNNADWAFVLIVVDSSADNESGDGTPGAFTDAQYMISRTFGPLAVMTYNNGTRGADNMEWATAQLVARMFGAGFQLEGSEFQAGGCDSATKKFGYLGIANTYCALSSPSPRLMYHGTGDPDSTTREQVGWRDADSDGIIDPMDTRPSILFSPYPFNPTTDNPLTYVEGGSRQYRAYENPLSPTTCLNRPTDECFHSYYHDVTPDNLAVTINQIETVEYRIDGGTWSPASITGPADYKTYSFTTPTLTGGKRKIEVQARNSVGQYSMLASETVIVAVSPTNDDFDSRINILSLPYNHAVNTTTATPTSDTYSSHADPIPVSSSCQNTRRGLHSVWYDYEATTDDLIYADTVYTDYTTVLSVWQDGTSGLELVVCDDGSDGEPSKVQFTSNAGTRYYFMISQYNNIAGSMEGASEVGGQSGGTLVFRVYSAININVTIGGVQQGSYQMGYGEEKRLYYPLSGGPVKVASEDGDKIVSAIRLQSYANDVLYSFVETMGVPAGLLSHKYYFPTYNNTWTPLNSQIRLGNLETTSTRIRITIGGMNVWEEDVPGLEERRLYFSVSGGPVVVESLDTSKKIVAAIRLQSYANDTLYSFSETMGIPEEYVSYKYVFPTYNNTWAPLNSQIRLGNLESTTTRIRITIGGVSVWEDDVPGLQERRLYFAVSGGPVVVESLDSSKKIVAAIRLQSYANDVLYSFVETMGVPEGLLSYRYVFPTYNNTWVPLNSQIRFGNIEPTTTRIRVTIGNEKVWEDDVPGLQERRLYFALSSGPVVIESLESNKKIVAAIRLQSYANNTLYSFSETMGIPDSFLSDIYYFPTYNNIWAPLNSQLRFGVP